MTRYDLMEFIHNKFTEMVENGSLSMKDNDVKDMIRYKFARDKFLLIATLESYFVLISDNSLRGIKYEQSDGLTFLEEMDYNEGSLNALPEQDFNCLSTKIKSKFIGFLSGDYIPKEYFMTEGYSYEDSVWFVDDILLALLEKDSISDSEKEKLERICELWFGDFYGYDISSFEEYRIEVIYGYWEIQLAYLKSLLSPFIEDGYIEDDIEGERFVVNDKFYECMDWMEYVKAW